MHSTMWQPTMNGPTLHLRPLLATDFDALHAAASDPLIWEQHPEPNRHEREVFARYFASGLTSGGALIALHEGAVVGSSRYHDFDAGNATVEIGYSFLTRRLWGGTFNRELKTLMLTHAFRFVEQCVFVVGKNNHRSRHAMLKIGGVEVPSTTPGVRAVDPKDSVVYRIRRADFETVPAV